MLARDDAPLEDRLTECLAGRPEILEAYLFGSSARGEAQPHSDVDVAVFVDFEQSPSMPFGRAATLGAELMAALGRDDIDIVILNEAPPLLYHRVLRDGQRLVARDLMATTTREGRALSRYCDYVPQLTKIDAAHSARIARGDFGR